MVAKGTGENTYFDIFLTHSHSPDLRCLLDDVAVQVQVKPFEAGGVVFLFEQVVKGIENVVLCRGRGSHPLCFLLCVAVLGETIFKKGGDAPH